MKDFFCAREQHICQQIGENKTQQMPTDKAGVVKVSRKITTQHRQLIIHEIFMKNNTEQN